jgi:hypothetical protein
VELPISHVTRIATSPERVELAVSRLGGGVMIHTVPPSPKDRRGSRAIPILDSGCALTPRLAGSESSRGGLLGFTMAKLRMTFARSGRHRSGQPASVSGASPTLRDD